LENDIKMKLMEVGVDYQTSDTGVVITGIGRSSSAIIEIHCMNRGTNVHSFIVENR
jgi:hypothetical protein